MRTWFCLPLVFIVSTANAFQPGDIERAEGVLSQLTLERGTFVACASDKVLAGHLTDSWARDLTDAGELLPRIATTRDFHECRICPWGQRCWGLPA